MTAKLKTIKVTEKTVKNLNFIAFYTDKTQYEVAEIASEEKRQSIEKKMHNPKRTKTTSPKLKK